MMGTLNQSKYITTEGHCVRYTMEGIGRKVYRGRSQSKIYRSRSPQKVYCGRYTAEDHCGKYTIEGYCRRSLQKVTAESIPWKVTMEDHCRMLPWKVYHRRSLWKVDRGRSHILRSCIHYRWSIILEL